MSKKKRHNRNNKAYTFFDIFCRPPKKLPEAVQWTTDDDDDNHRAKFSTLKEAYEATYDRSRKTKNPYKLKKKRLWDYEILEYKRFGKPDLTQNWLELFTPDVVDDLFTTLNFGSDNYKKADYVIAELSDYGFREVAEGTNIIVLDNPYYPGVVFKIALDSNGIADNFNDQVLQHEVPRYAKVYARHSSGIVSVQERYVTMTEERIKEFIPEIIDLLKKLSREYLVADLSPSRFLNFGVARDGEFVIIDGSDLFPLSELTEKPRCKKSVGYNHQKKKVITCNGRMEYTADFLSMICGKCGREVNPLELRPKSKEGDSGMANFMMDGLTPEERKELEKQEIETIRRKLSGNGHDSITIERRTLAETVERIEEQVGDTQTDSPDIVHVESVVTHEVFHASEQGPDKVDYHPADDEDEDDDEGDGEIEPIKLKRKVPHHPPVPDKVKLVARRPDEESDEDDDEDTCVVVAHNRVFEESVLALDEVFPGELTQRILSAKQNPTKKSQEEIIQLFSEHVRTVLCVVEDEEDDAEQKPEPTPQLDDDTPHIEYSLQPLADDVGLYMNIKGDFDDAWENSGIPIYVSFDNGVSYTLAVRSSVTKMILDKMIPDIIEEQLEQQDED